MATGNFAIRANVVDISGRRVFPAEVRIADGKIAEIGECQQSYSTFLLPGFVDAHVHVESSMLPPSEFSRAAVIHGTVATVSDPHEIANVLGIEGVRFMLADAESAPLKFHFGAPSCVPATPFETAGDSLDATQVAELLDDPRIGYLSEMMNVPGALVGDEEVMAKLGAAAGRGKPADGHAPGLRGHAAQAYFAAGITTDHECVTAEEGADRLRLGVKLLIREGSAARNFEALCSLIDDHPGECMFCTDDLHPDDLLHGHIDRAVATAVDRGLDLFHVLHAACVAPVEHYRMNVGVLRPGDPADCVEVEDLKDFRVLRTFIDGQLVAKDGETRVPRTPSAVTNRFHREVRDPQEFRVPANSGRVNTIEVCDGQLITRHRVMEPRIEGGHALADPQRDLLKIAVVNRYQSAAPAVAFVHGCGLRHGAIASSVAHDSHNVIAVGASDEDLCQAVNAVMASDGGLSAVDQGVIEVLALPIAGLMSTLPYDTVAEAYAKVDRFAKDRLGSPLRAPFMTLSFLALLVIPEIKLSDRGLFDVRHGEFMPLFD